MKVHTTRFSFILVLIYFICLIFVYIPWQETQADENEGEIRIGTNPARGFLQAHNLAPGDGVTATLRIHNDGSHDFQYAVGARLEQGSPTLFNALSLTIADRHSVLYEGELNRLSYETLGTLARSAQDELTFTAELPRQAGNELQDQSASVSFDFIAGADGAHRSSPAATQGSGNEFNAGGKLPQTASAIYNFFLLGLLLIGCGLLIWRFKKRVR